MATSGGKYRPKRCYREGKQCSPAPSGLASVAELVDLPAAAMQHLARRAGRESNELLAAWRAKTLADCERFWNTLTPNVDDDLLRAVAILAIGQAHEVRWQHRSAIWENGSYP